MKIDAAKFKAGQETALVDASPPVIAERLAEVRERSAVARGPRGIIPLHGAIRNAPPRMKQ